MSLFKNLDVKVKVDGQDFNDRETLGFWIFFSDTELSRDRDNPITDINNYQTKIEIIFLFVTICIAYSIDLLRSFVVDTKYFSFALMTETILGPKWLKFNAVSSFIIYVSMEVSYLSSIYVYIQGIFNITDVWFTILYFFISMVIEIIICIYISKNAKMHLLSLANKNFKIYFSILKMENSILNFNYFFLIIIFYFINYLFYFMV